MKRHHGFVLSVVCLILLPLSSTESAQVQPFDLKKCRQELEIMKGILRTTLSFAAKELASSSAKEDDAKTFRVLMRGGEFSNISGFYLAGQGAVFTIPAGSLRDAFRVRGEFNFKNAFNLNPGTFEFDFDEEALVEEVTRQTEDAMRQAEDAIRQAQEAADLAAQGIVAPPKPPEPPAAPVPPAPAVSPATPRARAVVAGRQSVSEKSEQARKKLAELQERAKRKMEEEEARRTKFREALGQLKGFLIEALANHGDSISTVKPNEYINLVILDEGRSFWLGEDPSGERAQRDIISVQRAVISDYKAGRLSLDSFKQKVMNYIN